MQMMKYSQNVQRLVFLVIPFLVAINMKCLSENSSTGSISLTLSSSSRFHPTANRIRDPGMKECIVDDNCCCSIVIVIRAMFLCIVDPSQMLPFLNRSLQLSLDETKFISCYWKKVKGKPWLHRFHIIYKFIHWVEFHRFYHKQCQVLTLFVQHIAVKKKVKF